MILKPDKQFDQCRSDPREISRWARIYAQNRSLPVVVLLILFVLLSLAIGLPSYLAGEAYREGQMARFGVYIALLALSAATLVYLSVPAWGGRRMEGISRRIYAKEGNVALAPEKGPYPARVTGLLIGGFTLCIAGSVVFGMLGYIPDRYMQPVSALYCVPFLVILTFLMRPAIGWLSLLWPIFYGLHAILVVAGVPIQFTGQWKSFNILAPMVVYGIFAALLAHFYSRYALRRLKKIAQSGLNAVDQAVGGQE